MSIELLELNRVTLDPVDDLRGLCFDGEDLATFHGNRGSYQGITRAGAASIVHRLWFMGYDLVKRQSK